MTRLHEGSSRLPKAKMLGLLPVFTVLLGYPMLFLRGLYANNWAHVYSVGGVVELVFLGSLGAFGALLVRRVARVKRICNEWIDPAGALLALFTWLALPRMLDIRNMSSGGIIAFVILDFILYGLALILGFTGIWALSRRIGNDISA